MAVYAPVAFKKSLHAIKLNYENQSYEVLYAVLKAKEYNNLKLSCKGES